MFPRLSCSRTLSLCPQSRQKSGNDALAILNCLSARIMTGLSICAAPCIPLPLNPFSTGVLVFATFATFRPEEPALATIALVGPTCPRLGGATGDGLTGAAAARAAVVGDVTGGIIGPGTAAAGAAPGTPDCTLIDEV